MKTKHLIIFIIISFLIGGSAVLIAKVLAQETEGLENIQYPIKELGNCKNKVACKAYCDKPGNVEACINFAEKKNLMPKEEIDTAKKFIAAGSKGPGGCKTKDACEEYCNDINHIDACISFAEKNDLMPPQELEEAKKIQAVIKRGVKPPPCGNKKACDVYCEDSNHMEECITFGAEAGFIQGKELEDAKKMLTAVKKGVKPPPCRGKEACDKYCGAPENMEVCMTFAIEAGFMSEEEKTNSQKMLEAIKKGVKPPACKGKEECDTYCAEKEHFEECLNFAEAAGFMSAEDTAMARKTGGESPGNCKGKEECEAFCNNPDNQETCFNFAKEHGMIPEEDLKRMEEGKQQFKKSMTQIPPEVTDCLKSLVGEEMFEKLKNGSIMPPKEIGEQMRTCFEKTMGPQQNGMTPSEGQLGPGGCKNPEECKAYCESHPEECQKFQPSPGVETPGEQMMPQQAGPGGCKGPEECQVYCESHPDECKNLGPGGGEQSGQFAPGTGPSGPTGPEGQSGQLPPTGPPMGPTTGPTGCQSPEECQQMQNMMAPPASFQPPMEQQPPTNQQPPTEGTMPPPPPAKTPPPSTETAPPSSETTPPPSGAMAQKLLLEFLLNMFSPASHR